MAIAQPKTAGRLVRLQPGFDDLIAKQAKLEVLADTFLWSEGPVWVKDGGYLLLSDVKRNTMYKWNEGEGLSVFLQPSGYTGPGVYSEEPGSNGLILNQRGELVACEHGDRRVSAMSLSTRKKRTIADNYQGKRFNSPNDIVQKSNGDYYFTDPIYGLPKEQQEKEKLRGVYRIDTAGKVTLLISDLTPNGLRLFTR